MSSTPSVSAGRSASTPSGVARRPRGPRTKLGTAALVAAVALALLAAGGIWDLSIGTAGLTAPEVIRALLSGADPLTHDIVVGVRLPRVVLAIVAGAAIAVAGVLMQGATANPLAAPDVVGVSAGAALIGVLGTAFLTTIPPTALILLSIGGAGAAAVIVLAVAGAGQGRTGPVRLALAGVTVTAMLMSFTQALLLLNQTGTAGVFFWLVGGVNFAQWSTIVTVLPWCAVGLLGAMALAPSMDILALGDDTARGLGLHVTRTRLLAVLCTVCLAGAAVAVAGPIAFVGLIVPHISRLLVGSSHAIVIPISALIGSVLVTGADVACRYVQFPFETPTGVITALLGAPFF
ncbi:MAG: iron ABC transporter permease, partial [Streptomyces sp.]|nr:iron ABC transporter permease [Streptomyces sp.]